MAAPHPDSPTSKMIHAGRCSVVDDLGGVPILAHTLSSLPSDVRGMFE
jgi:hypothetical protein